MQAEDKPFWMTVPYKIPLTANDINEHVWDAGSFYVDTEAECERKSVFLRISFTYGEEIKGRSASRWRFLAHPIFATVCHRQRIPPPLPRGNSPDNLDRDES